MKAFIVPFIIFFALSCQTLEHNEQLPETTFPHSLSYFIPLDNDHLALWGGVFDEETNSPNIINVIHKRTGVWEPRSLNIPENLTSTLVMKNHNRTAIFGGKTQSNKYNSVLWLVQDNRWTSLKLPITSRTYAGGCYTNNEIIIFGGQNKQGKKLSDGVIYDIRSGVVHKISLPGMNLRSHTVHCSDEEVLFIGGRTKKGVTNAITMLDLTRIKPKKMNTPMKPSINQAITRYKKKMFFYGGRQSSKVVHNDMWKWDLESKKWQRIQHPIPSGRTDMNQFVYKNYWILMHGKGVITQSFNDIFVFDLASEKWITPRQNKSCASPRFGHAFHYQNKKIYIAGGLDNGHMQKDGCVMELMEILNDR